MSSPLLLPSSLLIPSVSLSGLILKLNRFLEAKLLLFSPPPVISEEVAEEESSFKLQFVCGLFILTLCQCCPLTQIALLLPLFSPSFFPSPCVELTGSKFSLGFARLREPYLCPL